MGSYIILGFKKIDIFLGTFYLPEIGKTMTSLGLKQVKPL